MIRHSRFALLCILTLCLVATLSFAQNATAMLDRAIKVVGIEHLKNNVLHYRAGDAVLQNYQSDRTYEPFFSMMLTHDLRTDMKSLTQFGRRVFVYPGVGPGDTVTTVSTPGATFIVRGDAAVQVPSSSGPDRNLDPWLVLLDWKGSGSLQLGKREYYRDFPRDLITRKTAHGEERLFVDPKTGFPVKLDLQEKHYLWGQVHVEYVYSNWEDIGGSFYPLSSFRIVDGSTEVSRTVGQIELASQKDFPTFSLPALKEIDDTPMFLRPLPPDTVRVGPTAFLLVNRGYAEGIIEYAGTVFVLDATQGEGRAKLDEAWIQKLFPKYQQIVVIVTDLAWPHVAGVRYWVSRGAKIVSHRMSESFLRKVVNREWTLNPDELERHRTARLRFTAVENELSLAGGKIRIAPINGIGSEGALMAYLPEEKFLWASDYIQQTDQVTEYAREVRDAVMRMKFSPERVAAEHLKLTDWGVIESLLKKGTP